MAINPIQISGQREIEALLKRYPTSAIAAMEKAGFEEGLEIIDASQALVPVNFGILKNSWGIQTLRTFLGGTSAARFTIEPPRAGEIVIGYGGAARAYAVAVHENPRAGKTGGVSPSGGKYKFFATTGRWKYLSQPFKARKGGIAKRMAIRMKQLIGDRP